MSRRNFLKQLALAGTGGFLAGSGLSKLLGEKIRAQPIPDKIEDKEYEISLVYDGDSVQELQLIINKLKNRQGVEIKLTHSNLTCPEEYSQKVEVPLADGSENVSLEAGLIIPPNSRIKIQGTETQAQLAKPIGIYVSPGAELELSDMKLTHGRANGEQKPLQEDAYILPC